MLVQLIQLPYDSGHAGTRMGRGPAHLVAGGAAEALRAAGHRVETLRVESAARFPAEIATTFELSRLLARQVRMASNQKRFPLVLAGNCQTAVGTLAGLSRGEVGVVWLDAHSDLNTPDTTRSGMLDGMALATAMGLCWRGAAAEVPGHRPVPGERVVLVGARDVEPGERETADREGVTLLPPEGVRAGALEPALDALRARVERVYLHLDLDVLDPAEVGPANPLTPPGGLSVEEALGCVAAVRERFRLSAAALTAYDPALDPGGAVLATATRLMEALVG